MPPNILWIMTDQLRRDCVGAYGSRGVRTPNMDGLAAEGVTFDRFYTTCPLCVPARASLHTGRYPHSCGSMVNGFSQRGDEDSARLKGGEVTVDALLAGAGYHMGHVGVDHVKQEPPLRRSVDWAKFVSVPEHNRYLQERGLARPDLSAHQKPCPTRFGDEVREVRFSSPTPGRHPFAPEDYLDVYYGREAASFLREAPADRPFALFLFLWLPHPPFVIPEPYYSMYGPQDVDPPPSLMAPQTGKPEMHLTHLPGQVGADPTREEWLASWAAYFGCVALADECIGRALQALEETGRADDTLIVCHPDHGEMLGEFRYFQKMLCYESAAHLPLIVRPPRGTGDPGSRRSQLCSHTDIMPTLLDYAGIEVPQRVQGASLRRFIDEPAAPGPGAAFIEYNGNVALDHHQRCIVTDRHKLIWNMGGFVELYDLREDPWEMHNLAGTPEAADIEAVLLGELRTWMRETGDILAVEG